MNKELINEIQSLFVPTVTLAEILDNIKRIRNIANATMYSSEPTCMLVTGETGTGKSEFIKQYLANHPRVEEADRTKIPVLVSLIPKAKHPKPVVSQMLRDLGDPLEGVGGDSTALTDRLVTLLKNTGVELIILDEFQHLIETKSNQVVYDIADFIKTLVNRTNIPIVLFGLPWSSYVLEVNAQLARRFMLKHELINYTPDTYTDFQKFLGKIQDKLPIQTEVDLWRHETAFRMFAGSHGNVSNLMNSIIRPAAIDAIINNEKVIKNQYFAQAIQRFTQVRKELNPFLMDLNSIVADVQHKSSYWNRSAPSGESRVVDISYTKVKFKDLTLNDVFSK